MVTRVLQAKSTSWLKQKQKQKINLQQQHTRHRRNHIRLHEAEDDNLGPVVPTEERHNSKQQQHHQHPHQNQKSHLPLDKKVKEDKIIKQKNHVNDDNDEDEDEEDEEDYDDYYNWQFAYERRYKL